jgi:hypothetical protein
VRMHRINQNDWVHPAHVVRVSAEQGNSIDRTDGPGSPIQWYVVIVLVVGRSVTMKADSEDDAKKKAAQLVSSFTA